MRTFIPMSDQKFNFSPAMAPLVETFHQLKKLYRLSLSLSLSDAQAIFKAAKMTTFPAGAYLVEQGSRERNVFLIRKGLVRAFMVNDKGDEITIMLRREHQIVAIPEVLISDQPSDTFIQALEPTEVFYTDFDAMQAIIENNPKLEKNRKYILRDILMQTLKHSRSFILYSPEERYVNYVKENPEMVNRVPGKYIAHVLGITPVSLSRIRKRLAEKGRKKT